MLYGKWLLNRRCRCRQRFDKNTYVHQRSSYPDENMSPCRIVVSNDISSLLMTSSPNLLVNPCLDWNTTWLAVTQLSLRLRCFASPVFFFSHRWTSRGYAVHFVTRRERSMYSQGTITGTSDARNEIVRQVPHHRDSYNTKMRTRTGRISCIERAGILAYYKKSVVASLSK